MPNKLHNWTFRQVVTFLKKKGFTLNNTNGSHFYYVAHISGKLRNVCVPFHGNNATIKTRTMKGIILQSGIQQSEWLL